MKYAVLLGSTITYVEAETPERAAIAAAERTSWHEVSNAAGLALVHELGAPVRVTLNFAYQAEVESPPRRHPPLRFKAAEKAAER